MIYRRAAIGLAIAAAVAVAASLLWLGSSGGRRRKRAPQYEAVAVVGGPAALRREVAESVQRHLGHQVVFGAGRAADVIDAIRVHAPARKFVLNGFGPDEDITAFNSSLPRCIHISKFICVGASEATIASVKKLYPDACVVDANGSGEAIYQQIKGELMYKIIFVLGGPGSGKGTQCGLLAERFGISHFSAGDLLREERASGSKEAEMINQYIRDGLIVPARVTVGLLRKAIFSSPSRVILIDGFPRSMENLEAWLETMKDTCDVSYLMFLDCTEEEMERRLLERGKTSGRVDDNIDSIRKRFRTYRESTMPIIEKFRAENKVRQIQSNRPIEAVFLDTSKVVEDVLASL